MFRQRFVHEYLPNMLQRLSVEVLCKKKKKKANIGSGCSSLWNLHYNTSIGLPRQEYIIRVRTWNTNAWSLENTKLPALDVSATTNYIYYYSSWIMSMSCTPCNALRVQYSPHSIFTGENSSREGVASWLCLDFMQSSSTSIIQCL